VKPSLYYAQKRKELSLSADLQTSTEFNTMDRPSSIERAMKFFCVGKAAVNNSRNCSEEKAAWQVKVQSCGSRIPNAVTTV